MARHCLFAKVIERFIEYAIIVNSSWIKNHLAILLYKSWDFLSKMHSLRLGSTQSLAKQRSKINRETFLF